MSNLAFLPLIPVLLLAGCASLAGSGHVVEEARTVDGSFSSIAIRNGLHLTVVVGEAFSVTVHGDDNIVEAISTVVSGDQLIVDLPDTLGGFVSEVEVGAIVTLPELTGVFASGGSTVDASGIDAAAFEFQTSGGSVARMNGRVAVLALQASGGSVIEAAGLACEEASLEMSGGSVAKLSISNAVSAQLSGGSEARVQGRPAIREQSLTGGSTLKLE